MPNDVTEIIQDANGAILFRREDGTYQTFTHGVTLEDIPFVESNDTITMEVDIPFVELPNEREFTATRGDTAWIAGTYEGEPVYAVNPREEAGVGLYYEDDPSEETELLCLFVGIRADADFLGRADRNNRVHDECCIIAQTGELVCYMDGKLTAWSRDDYRIKNETMQVRGGPQNAVIGEVMRAVHVFVKPDASYPYRSAGCVDDGAIAEAFDEVYA